jgi:hypothetical protein
VSTGALADHLNLGLDLARWSTTDLWLAAVALGTDLSQTDIATIRTGDRIASHGEYDVLAAALDEHFTDIDLDHPMRDWAELQP